MEAQFKAVVVTPASKIMEKSNNSRYVVHTVQIMEGPLKGRSVGASRTIVNAEGKEKEGVAVGENVIAYMSEVDGKFYFEIGQPMAETLSDKEIMDLLTAKHKGVETTVDAQGAM